MKHMLCFGCGYSSTQTAKELLKSGKWRITGTTRSLDTSNSLEKIGIDAKLWPGTQLEDVLGLATHWLISIPPKLGKDVVIEYLNQQPDDQFVNLQWIGYFSTTAVYGDHDGNWVDESTPVNPTTQRGKYRVMAEDAWEKLAARLGVPLCIFRLAGIYGPGRGPMEQLRKGNRRKILKPDQYFNRIHVEDIAGIVNKAISTPAARGIFNLSDNLPERSDKVIDYAADLLEIPKPAGTNFEDAELSEMARSFYSESKRVRNQRIKTVLGYELAYPDYKTGLRKQVQSLNC
ncbi:MAG: SDR family oxidoreductase [Rhodobacteraceae bacterium]|nr:SDR family oxidoreductase [Paracoccaceae bacterium]